MKINGVFHSIQGEGPEAGVPTTFIRLSGCNLQCEFCDTRYANKGEEVSLNKLEMQVKDFPGNHLTITGGEPTLQDNEVFEFYNRLRNRYSLSLETNGTLPTRVPYKVIVVSPKKQAINKDILRAYATSENKANIYFKFVYESRNDKWWEAIIRECSLPLNKVYMMPEGKTRAEQLRKMPEMIKYCMENNFRFSPRLHVLAFGNKRGV
jgi:7-carboxy-7-deazaguanine synthase